MSEWVEEEFKTATFGDRRLLTRMRHIVASLAKSPKESLAAALRGWAEVVGAYRFFNNLKVTTDKVMAPHRQALLERLKQHPRALVVQDTTELDFTSKKKVQGSGPLSTTHRRGFFAHTQLVLTPERLPLGVLDTKIYARTDEDHGKSAKRKQLPIEEKESYRWLQGYHKACQLAEAAPGVEVISCSDQEGDIYEVFQAWHERKQNHQVAAQWLIRCARDRNLCSPLNGKIRAAVQASPVLGHVSLDIKAKQQKKKIKGRSRVKIWRSARQAVLEVRTKQVSLKPAYRIDRKLPVVTIQIVSVQELHPPAGEEPISWFLLTSLPVPDLHACLDLIALYTARWEIEVFHRVLKTGCRVEELQLKKDQRIFLAVSLYMIVAWRVLYVMRLGRECPELPCDVVFEEDEWQALWIIVHGEKALHKKPSLGEFVRKLAEFGGFLARKSDGHPGPQAIWVGMARVRDFAFAWQHFGKGYFPGTY